MTHRYRAFLLLPGLLVEEAYETITRKALDWTAVPEKYKARVKAGFGLRLDHKRTGWDVGPYWLVETIGPANLGAAPRSPSPVGTGPETVESTPESPARYRSYADAARK